MSETPLLSKKFESILKEIRQKKNHDDSNENGIDWNDGKYQALEDVLEELKPILKEIKKLEEKVDSID